VKDVERILQSFKHKPRNTNTLSYTKFRESLIQKIQHFQSLYPFISFQEELEIAKGNV
jgi:hypothetical protein